MPPELPTPAHQPEEANSIADATGYPDDFLIEPEARGVNPYLPEEYRERLIETYRDLAPAAPGPDEPKAWTCLGTLVTTLDIEAEAEENPYLLPTRDEAVDYEKAKLAIKNYFGGRELRDEPMEVQEPFAVSDDQIEDVTGRSQRVLVAGADAATIAARVAANLTAAAENAGVPVVDVLRNIEASMSQQQLQQAQGSWIELSQYNSIRKAVKDSKRGSHACACGTPIARNKTSCRTCNESLQNAPATAGACFSANV